jgi:hypothetical protein
MFFCQTSLSGFQGLENPPAVLHYPSKFIITTITIMYPFQVFQAKIQALKNPIHEFCADWVGGWVGCRAHTDYN